MPEGTASAVITDPPYCSGGATLSQKAAATGDKYIQQGTKKQRPSFGGDHRDNRSFAFWCAFWITELHRIVPDESYFMSFIDWRQLGTMADAVQAGGFSWRGVAAWDKGRGSRAPHKGFLRHQCEYIVWGTKGRCFKPKAGPGHPGPIDGCLKYPVKQSDKHHQTGKPTELLAELVSLTQPDSVVIDPFAGSSTTGVACALSGRGFIGIEASEEYCEISARRLEAALNGEVLRAA